MDMYPVASNDFSQSFENWSLPYSQLCYAFGWTSLSEYEGYYNESDQLDYVVEDNDIKIQHFVEENYYVIKSDGDLFGVSIETPDVKIEPWVTKNDHFIKTEEYVEESDNFIKAEHFSTETDNLLALIHL